jgi:hypothetical protein
MAQMHMEAAHGIAQFLINDHSWYRFETTADYVRAGLWCLSNLATSLSYFLLPIEIRHWRVALPFKSSTLIGTLFIAFIATCGASHLSMLIIMPTAPWWMTILIYLPMAFASVATAVVVRRERRLIIAVLQGVRAALAESSE